jgi:hypothetical protein
VIDNTYDLWSGVYSYTQSPELPTPGYFVGGTPSMIPSYNERLRMHYQRFSPSNTWTLLARQPTYRLALYGVIVLSLTWTLLHFFSPLESGLPLPWSGFDPPPPKWPVHYSPIEDVPVHVWENRAQQVKRAFTHAYSGYRDYAAPHDELLPKTNGSADK